MRLTRGKKSTKKRGGSQKNKYKVIHYQGKNLEDLRDHFKNEKENEEKNKYHARHYQGKNLRDRFKNIKEEEFGELGDLNLYKERVKTRKNRKSH